MSLIHLPIHWHWANHHRELQIEIRLEYCSNKVKVKKESNVRNMIWGGLPAGDYYGRITYSSYTVCRAVGLSTTLYHVGLLLKELKPAGGSGKDHALSRVDVVRRFVVAEKASVDNTSSADNVAKSNRLFMFIVFVYCYCVRSFWWWSLLPKVRRVYEHEPK